MNELPLLIYLHGLNSSPASEKARHTREFIRAQSLNLEVKIPQLPVEPDEVVSLLQSLVNDAGSRPVYIVGSSLGGFLGTWLQDYLLSRNSESLVKLVLINPAVNIYERFEEFLGPQVNMYTEEHWTLTHRHAEQLRELEVEELKTPEDIFLLVQTDDEVLDYRLAVNKYKNCRSIIQQGGDHSFVDYERMLPVIFEFFGVS